MEAVRCEYVNKMLAIGGQFDFANEIASGYLLRVVMPLLGIPSSACALMLGLTKQLFGPADPDSRRMLICSAILRCIGDKSIKNLLIILMRCKIEVS